ncbi:MAG: hypothetical protein CL911_04825, partial [Deltaproteobacteria bacterium]|nr:hypothetical protein [Deltaproteobacteria bacterium]
PPLKLIMIAMRAVSAHADALLKGLCDGLTFILDPQGIGQLPFLCRAQPLKTQKILFEFSMIHLFSLQRFSSSGHRVTDPRKSINI